MALDKRELYSLKKFVIKDKEAKDLQCVPVFGVDLGLCCYCFSDLLPPEQKCPELPEIMIFFNFSWGAPLMAIGKDWTAHA